jgi:SAM-dependent methyltransferase
MTGQADRPVGREPDARARALARLYDLDLRDDPGDLDLYLALAARADGPILELAAGTGRHAIPLAEAGHAVTAVDLDPAMLERAAARLAAAPPAVARRVDLIEADLLHLDLSTAGTFGLAFIALNSLFLLASRSDQQRALRVVAAHLAPGGIAAIDIWLPDADDLGRFDGRMILEYQRRDPETDVEVTKVAAARYDAATSMVELTSVYEEGEPGAAAVRWIRRDTLRLVGADELRSMAQDAGLVVEEIGGDYGLEPLGPGSDRAILVARRS